MKAGRITWSIVGLLSLSAAARAGAVLELVPSNPGPYYGSEELTVDFWLRSDLDWDVDLRGVLLDFQDTHSALVLSPEFVFDSTFLDHGPLGLDYTLQTALPIPSAFFSPQIFLPPGSLVVLPSDEALRIGSLAVQLPAVPGAYALDALNADERDYAQGGASLVVVSGTFWFAYSGEFSGGRFDFHIVPEPSGLALLIAGSALLASAEARRK